MNGTHFFELVIALLLAIIALHYVATKLRLPPSAALLAGGGLLAFAPGVPVVTIDPQLVLVIFLPPLLLDGAWSIAVARFRRHLLGVSLLAVGAVAFTTAAVAVVARLIFPDLPWAACAALGAIVSPPDAVAVRAVLERVRLPKRLRILLDGESLLNDASGLVIFRFAVGAVATGTFDLQQALGEFIILAVGGIAVGFAIGTLWTRFVRLLGDDYLVIAATALLAWLAYLAGELLHVSGVMATVTTGLVATWNQHAVLSAAIRMRGSSFWAVMVFLMEAAVFILIGLSLRDVVDRGGGFSTTVFAASLPTLAIFATLVIARLLWVFLSDLITRVLARFRLTQERPVGAAGALVLSWAGIRGVVTLALALSLPEGFPGRDFILVASFSLIALTVLVQGTTLARVVAVAGLADSREDRAPLTINQAEAAIVRAQLSTVEKLAYDEDGTLVHPQLLDSFRRRSTATNNYADRTEHYTPLMLAHYDVVLAAVRTGRSELLKLHRTGQIDDETLVELERDLDLEELSALSASAQ